MSECLEWVDNDGVKHTMTKEGAIRHLKRFYEEWYDGFDELEAEIARYRKMIGKAANMVQALEWIQRNPGAHPNNIQAVVKFALDKVKE